MPVGGGGLGSNLLIANTALLFKIGLVAFSALYFVFSLIVVRQVSLMSETVKTKFGGILRVFSILFAGLALGILVLFVGFF